MSLLRQLPLAWRASVVHEAGRAARYKDWYASAMAMVAAMPAGVAWADPGKDFAVTYANPVARAMLAPAAGHGPLEGRSMLALFPLLALSLIHI